MHQHIECHEQLDVKTDFLDGGLLGDGSGAAEFQREEKQFGQTQQLEAEANERDRDNIVGEERHVAGHEYAASTPAHTHMRIHRVTVT